MGALGQTDDVGMLPRTDSDGSLPSLEYVAEGEKQEVFCRGDRVVVSDVADPSLDGQQGIVQPIEDHDFKPGSLMIKLMSGQVVSVKAERLCKIAGEEAHREASSEPDRLQMMPPCESTLEVPGTNAEDNHPAQSVAEVGIMNEAALTSQSTSERALAIDAVQPDDICGNTQSGTGDGTLHLISVNRDEAEQLNDTLIERQPDQANVELEMQPQVPPEVLRTQQSETSDLDKEVDTLPSSSSNAVRAEQLNDAPDKQQPEEANLALDVTPEVFKTQPSESSDVDQEASSMQDALPEASAELQILEEAPTPADVALEVPKEAFTSTQQDGPVTLHDDDHDQMPVGDPSHTSARNTAESKKVVAREENLDNEHDDSDDWPPLEADSGQLDEGDVDNGSNEEVEDDAMPPLTLQASPASTNTILNSRWCSARDDENHDGKNGENHLSIPKDMQVCNGTSIEEDSEKDDEEDDDDEDDDDDDDDDMPPLKVLHTSIATTADSKVRPAGTDSDNDEDDDDMPPLHAPPLSADTTPVDAHDAATGDDEDEGDESDDDMPPLKLVQPSAGTAHLSAGNARETGMWSLQPNAVGRSDTNGSAQGSLRDDDEDDEQDDMPPLKGSTSVESSVSSISEQLSGRPGAGSTALEKPAKAISIGVAYARATKRNTSFITTTSAPVGRSAACQSVDPEGFDSDDSMPPLDLGKDMEPDPEACRATHSDDADAGDCDSDDSMPPLNQVQESLARRPSANAEADPYATRSADLAEESDDSMPPLQSLPPQAQDQSIPPSAFDKNSSEESEGSDSDDSMPPLNPSREAPEKPDIPPCISMDSGSCSRPSECAPREQDENDSNEDDDSTYVDDAEDDGMPPLVISSRQPEAPLEGHSTGRSVPDRDVHAASQASELTRDGEDQSEDSDDSMPPLKSIKVPAAPGQMENVGAAPAQFDIAEDDEASDDSMPPVQSPQKLLQSQTVQSQEQEDSSADEPDDEMPPLVMLKGVGEPAATAGPAGNSRLQPRQAVRLDVHDAKPQSKDSTSSRLGDVSSSRRVQEESSSDSEGSMPPLVAEEASARRSQEQTATRFQPPGRSVDSATQSEQAQRTPPIASDNTEDILPGEFVVLVNLKTADLNGEVAKVLRVVPPTNVRQKVRLQLTLLKNGRCFLVKRANVQRVEEEGAEEESDDCMPPLVFQEHDRKPSRPAAPQPTPVMQSSAAAAQPSASSTEHRGRREKTDRIEIRKGFFVGDLVELRGVSRAELNGQRGHIMPMQDDFEIKRDRVIVKLLRNGKLLAVPVKRLKKLKAGKQDESSESDMPPLEYIAEKAAAGGSLPKPGKWSMGQQLILRNMYRTEYNGQVVTVLPSDRGKPLVAGQVLVQMSTGKRVIVPEGNLTTLAKQASTASASKESARCGNAARTSAAEDSCDERRRVEVLTERMRQAMSSVRVDLVSDLIAEVEAAQSLPWGDLLQKKKALLKKLRLKMKKLQAEAVQKARPSRRSPSPPRPAGQNTASSRVYAAPTPARVDPAQTHTPPSDGTNESKRSSLSERNWVVLGDETSKSAAAVEEDSRWRGSSHVFVESRLPAASMPAPGTAARSTGSKAAPASSQGNSSRTPEPFKPRAKPVARYAAAERPTAGPSRKDAAAASAVRRKEPSALEVWCETHQLPMELVERLRAEDVTDPLDLAAVPEEDLNAFAQGLRMGTKGRFLTAVRKMRVGHGL